MGGGYIALEFASMFSNLGTQVTILEHGDVIMPREDREVADLALQDLQDKGISVHTNVETTAFLMKATQQSFIPIMVNLKLMQCY